MVGDEDQSIYGFRAAYPDALLHFEQDYPNAKVLLMEQNYRSVPAIVAAADGFIARNQFRHPKRLYAVRQGDAHVQTVQVMDRVTQYAYLYEVGKSCKRETAILYRNNDSALPLIDLFDRNGVAFNCKQFEEAFFSHKVVTDIRDMITLAYEPCNGDAFMRIYYKFGSPITKSAAQYACDRSKKSGRPIWEELLNCGELNSYGREAAQELKVVMSQLPDYTAEEALERLWVSLRYNQFVAQRKLDGGKLDILRLLARRVHSPMDLLNRLDRLRQLVMYPVINPESPLILSTVHSAKGLEYDCVYLLDVFDGVLPAKGEGDIRNEEDLKQYEEDRRIYYVGMTRAKNELYLFTSPTMPSEFTHEIVAHLPKPVVDEGDVFGALGGNLLGKSYTDAEKGRGTVYARCGDRVLVAYLNREMEMLTLEDMFARRDRTVTYKAPEPTKATAVGKVMGAAVSRFTPGMPVHHDKFGKGVVLGVKDGKIEIRFEKDGVKALMLETVVQNKLLRQL